jgi:hypothetical protein
MPSTLHCVLLLGKYRLLLALADGHFVQTALSRQRLLTGGTRLENGSLERKGFWLDLAFGTSAVMCPAFNAVPA